MQLIFAPLWGKLYDKYGRKPILLLGMIGLGSTMLFFGLAGEIWMLYLAQVASGILSSAMFPVATTYISDSSDEKVRSGAMGKVGAAAGLGVTVGPGFAGILAGIPLSTLFLLQPDFACSPVPLFRSVCLNHCFRKKVNGSRQDRFLRRICSQL